MPIPASAKVAQVVLEVLVPTAGIGPPPLSIACASPPGGSTGVPYSHFFPASGGTPPYSFSITVGSLPPGLGLNALTGEASGTPTTVGVFPFTIQVTDSAAGSASVACSITVISGLGITCGSPPSGSVGFPYAHIFPVSGGVPPDTFAITVGVLPPGLLLNAGTGLVSGIPTTPGNFPFTIQVTDSTAATASVACAIIITVFEPLRITFRGVKRVKCNPEDEQLSEVPELPKVERAM